MKNETQENTKASKAEKFDPRALRLSQEHLSESPVKKEVMRVPIMKPSRQNFFAPHPDGDARIQVAVIDLKDEGEQFIVHPDLQTELFGEWVPKVLVPCLTRSMDFFFWPIRLPGPDGNLDTWNKSALKIAKQSGDKWIRLVANRQMGAYDVWSPIAQLEPPIWPESLERLMEIAFEDRVIDSLDHPVVKRLKGGL